MKKIFTILMSALALLTSSAVAQAAPKEFVFGVVDLQQAVASTKDGKSAKKTLEDLKGKKEKELEAKAEKIKAMEAELEKQLPLMTDKAKQEKIKVYQQEMMEAQTLYGNIQKELAQKQADLYEPILQKMGKIIEEISLEGGYSMVLDRTSGAVLYAEPKADITPEVIKRYNSAK